MEKLALDVDYISYCQLVLITYTLTALFLYNTHQSAVVTTPLLKVRI
jgi:hypothetical protein